MTINLMITILKYHDLSSIGFYIRHSQRLSKLISQDYSSINNKININHYSDLVTY